MLKYVSVIITKLGEFFDEPSSFVNIFPDLVFSDFCRVGETTDLKQYPTTCVCRLSSVDSEITDKEEDSTGCL